MTGSAWTKGIALAAEAFDPEAPEDPQPEPVPGVYCPPTEVCPPTGALPSRYSHLPQG